MIGVFATDVVYKRDAELLARSLKEKYIFLSINFDLEDCDKVMRIEAIEHNLDAIKQHLIEEGFRCVELDW